MGGLASQPLGDGNTRSITSDSPVMAGEWAGELAGGYGYSPGPSRSLIVGVGPPRCRWRLRPHRQ